MSADVGHADDAAAAVRGPGRGVVRAGGRVPRDAAANVPRAAPARDSARGGFDGVPLRTIGIGLCIGLFGAVLALSPVGRVLERAVAHEWIFELRGFRPAPADVVVVDMGERDTELATRARDDRRRSRHVYAELLERLDALGASAVVLDVAFEDATDEAADRALEEALAGDGRTVIFQRLTRTANGDVPVPPLPRFASAATTVAVFPLPKLPRRVDYYWPFFRALEPRAASGEYALRELPALRVAAWVRETLARVGIDALERLLDTLDGASAPDESGALWASRNLERTIVELRRAASAGRLSGSGTRLAIRDRFGDGDAARLLRALFERFAEPGVAYLNFYGPARTIRTLEHERVLDGRRGLRGSVAGKVVFVGHSAGRAVDQRDGFPTVYTRDDGLDLSGVEIAATAYANLLDGSVPRPLRPSGTVALHLALGTAAALIALHAGIVRAVVLTVALAGGCFAAAVHALDTGYRLLPLGVPVLVVLPLALFSGLLYRHVRSDLLVRRALQLLPSWVRRILGTAPVGEIAPERLHGTCMITDGAGYTRVAEALDGERLVALSREYFSLLVERTRAAGGELIDFEGDSMTAVWTGSTDDTGRLAATAAVEIGRLVERFNGRHPDTPLPTRIGLHSGELDFVNLGAGDEFRCRVIGNVVNTASRLEGLNKRLGTSVLATRETLACAATLLLRPVGRFVLGGKDEVLEIVEVRDVGLAATPRERLLRERFDAALAALGECRPSLAERRFAELLETFGSDGPARFYLDLLTGRAAPDVRLDESGIVVLEGK